VHHHEGPGLMNPHGDQVELSPEDIEQCRKDDAC
jgi:hypothetical protein